MAPRPTYRQSATLRRTPALLLNSRAVGESDLILQFLTRDEGRVSLSARGARNSKKRFAGALEPMHELNLEYEDRGANVDLGVLREARISRPRLGLVSRLSALECAGQALSWIRHALPQRTPEREIWQSCSRLLDALNDAGNARSGAGAEAISADPNSTAVSSTSASSTSAGGSVAAVERQLLAEFGMHLVDALGWGLELDACVSCRRECPAGQAAAVSPQRGGVVCRQCGGARRVIRGEMRMRLLGLGSGGALERADAEPSIELVEAVLRAHAGLE